jgi:hypothetical protein
LRERFHADGPTGIPTGSDIEVSRHEGDQGAAPAGCAAKTTKASILSAVVGFSELDDFVERVSIFGLLLAPGPGHANPPN